MLQIDHQRIVHLRALLDDLEYDAVQRTLRPNYFLWPFPPLDIFQKLILHLPERQRLSYEVLLLGQPIRRTRLESLWGVELVKDLLDLGLLETNGADHLRTANYSVISFLARYFVVSLNPYYPNNRDPDTPVYIGPDSLTLAASLPYHQVVDRCLDLCTGSGIQAILAAPTCREVTAVELNAEAARTARFNASLNGVFERVHVHCGDLYEGVPDGPYDLIISNPPFLPVPPQVEYPMCGHGGEDGLTILKPLLEGIPSRLAADGIALIYAEGVGDSHAPFVRSLLDDLAAREQLDAQLIVVSRLSVKNALVLKAVSLSKLKQSSMNELAQWRDLYQRLMATYTYNYILRLRRGRGQVTQVMAFDPHRGEQGLELQPGVIIKPR